MSAAATSVLGNDIAQGLRDSASIFCALRNRHPNHELEAVRLLSNCLRRQYFEESVSIRFPPGFRQERMRFVVCGL